jgi:hypothetical protein
MVGRKKKTKCTSRRSKTRRVGRNQRSKRYSRKKILKSRNRKYSKKKHTKRYSLKRGKNRGGGPGRRQGSTEEDIVIMESDKATELCRNLRELKLRKQLETIFEIFEKEVLNLTPSSFEIKCFFECTEKRHGHYYDHIRGRDRYVDYTNKPVIFAKVVKLINLRIKVYFGNVIDALLGQDTIDLEQMPSMMINTEGRGAAYSTVDSDNELQKRYRLLDVDTTQRAHWFLRNRVHSLAQSTENTPLLIVTHQDFMKEVIRLSKESKYPNIHVRSDPTHEGEIPNLGILHLEVDGMHIFLMRHCFACHNIKDEGVEKVAKKLEKWEKWGLGPRAQTWGENYLGPALNHYTEKKKKGTNWNYGELSICIQPEEDYLPAVIELKRIAEEEKVDISGGKLTFACSPLFRAMFTLIKVLQVIQNDRHFG